MNHGIALRTLEPLLAQQKARAELVPPDELTGAARELFITLVANPTARPWGAPHIAPLRDYCRVTVMWDESMRAVERDGVLVGDKPHPRFRALTTLGAERLRLARLLGIAVMTPPNALGNSRYADAKLTALGASMAATSAEDVDGLLG